MEHYIDELLRLCGLGRTNLLYSGGGHCYALLPNTEKVRQAAEDWNRRFNDWLCERIWKYGRLRKPSELLESALGCPFDPNCYAEYLESKFTELYNL